MNLGRLFKLFESQFLPQWTYELGLLQFSSVQSFNHVWLFATPWNTACQALLSVTNSKSLLKLMSMELVIPSNHFILCLHLLFLLSIFPNIRVFSSESSICIGQRIGVSASASVLPMNIQDWFPLGWTGLISLLSKGLSRVFSSTTIWKHQFFSSQPSLWFKSHICTYYWKNYSFDYMDLCQQSDIFAF